MAKEKTKVYTYTRVSTARQIGGYSLDAQKARMKAYADFNDYEIAGEYEDAGKSGKSIRAEKYPRSDDGGAYPESAGGEMERRLCPLWLQPQGRETGDQREEPVAIRTIFDKYIHTDMGAYHFIETHVQEMS